MKKYKLVPILFLSMLLLVCSQTKNPVKNPLESPKFVSLQSECKGSLSPKLDWSANNDTVIFSSHGDTIQVIHQNALYNCCSKIMVKVTQTSNGFDLSEADTGDLCHCMCDFDVTTMISDLSPGSYLIRLFDTDSSLVGSGVVDIPPKYTRFETSQSRCKGGSLNLKAEPIIPDTFGDSVLTWRFHDNTLWITHQNALYACCAKYKVNILTTPSGFDLLEYEIGPTCDCLCLYDITTTIYGIQPGTYVIRVFSPWGYLVDSILVDIPPKYSGFQSFQSDCRKELPKVKPEAIYPDYYEDSILVWSHADTAWVLHKNANYNCAAIIKVNVVGTPDGFDLHERDEATDWATCSCYFDILTVIYGLSPGVYHIRVFNTYGNLVDEVELVMPPKLKATALIPQ